MYISKEENVEVYFICYKKDMKLLEIYYDEVLDIHYWYFNAYLAYQYWQQNFKNLSLNPISKDLLVIAASKYILYKINNKDYKNRKEKKKLYQDLNRIRPLLECLEKCTDDLFEEKIT